MHRRFLLLIAAVAFVLAATLPATAAENDTFGVEPQPLRVNSAARGTFEIPLEPGAEFQDAIRIYNKTDEAIDLALCAADAEAGADGTISYGFCGSHPKGVGSWIELDRSTVTLGPRAEAVVDFRVNVGSSNPTPNLGALVVEESDKGQTTKRLRLIVRTVPPNTPTTSRRTRSLLLRSPWIMVAIVGLVAALVLVWIGRRRSRRSRDTVVPPGQIEELVPAEGSRPVVRRLGASKDERPMLDDDMMVEVDEGPELELEEIAPPAPPPAPKPVRKAPARKKPPARRAPVKTQAVKPKPARPRRATSGTRAKPKPTRSAKDGFIPLDEL